MAWWELVNHRSCLILNEEQPDQPSWNQQTLNSHPFSETWCSNIAMGKKSSRKKKDEICLRYYSYSSLLGNIATKIAPNIIYNK